LIARQYGTKVHSVEVDFDANAMTEIGFRRDNDWSVPTEEFFASYEKLESHELTAVAEGEVQSETEDSLLQSLEQQLRALEQTAGDGVLFIESGQGTGTDYPKTRHRQVTAAGDGESRVNFQFTVEPPLKVAVYRKR
jgi:hypothetical protein